MLENTSKKSNGTQKKNQKFKYYLLTVFHILLLFKNFFTPFFSTSH